MMLSLRWLFNQQLMPCDRAFIVALCSFGSALQPTVSHQSPLCLTEVFKGARGTLSSSRQSLGETDKAPPRRFTSSLETGE